MRRLWVFAMLLVTAGWSWAQEPPPLAVHVARFEVTGDNPLGANQVDAILAPFLGEHAGIEGLLAASDALEQALVAAGHTFHRVSLPPQDLASGIVTLKISTFKVADIRVTGNHYFSAPNIKRSLPKLEAGAPNLREVSRSLAVANEHPHKHLKVSFRDSEAQPDSLDAVVRVKDQRPWNLFGSFNNIGTSDTGETRLQAGGMYSDVTGHDDVLTTAITFSPQKISDLFQLGAFYQLPVYALSGWFTAFYVTSDVDIGNVGGGIGLSGTDISGAGDFVGFSFKHMLLPLGRYRQSITAAIQDRKFESEQFVVTNLRSRPISLRYDGGYSWATASADFYLEAVANLPWGGHNSNDAYDQAQVGGSARDGNDADWRALRLGARVSRELPREFLAVGRVNGQYTTQALIAGEQLGFGGERSIRGFEERTVAGDRGVIANLELWTPFIQQVPGLRFLAFYDIGYKKLSMARARFAQEDVLSSVGVGARWSWNQMAALSIDYGQPLANAEGEASDRGNSKWHVTLQVRY